MKGIREAPTYRPTADEFADPLRYIASIRAEAEAYGVCKIVPPKGWGRTFVHQPNRLRFKPKEQELGKISGDQRLASSFMDGLRVFLFVRGSPLERSMNGRIMFQEEPLALYQVFKSCCRRNGAAEVTRTGSWPDVAVDCGFDAAEGANIRSIYEKYVAEFHDYLSGDAKLREEQEAALEELPLVFDLKVPEPKKGDTFWRSYGDGDCLFGTVVKRVQGKVLVHFYENEATCKDSYTNHTSDDFLDAYDVSLMIRNGATPEQAVLEYECANCEGCSYAAKEEDCLKCAMCSCLYHAACMDPPTESPERYKVLEWVCSDCVFEHVDRSTFVQLATAPSPTADSTTVRTKNKLKLQAIASEAAAAAAAATAAADEAAAAAEGDNVDFDGGAHAGGGRSYGGGAASSMRMSQAKAGEVLGFGFKDADPYTLEQFKKKCNEWREEYLRERELEGITEQQLEEEFWRLTGPNPPKSHVTVLYGSDLDTSVVGSGFPTRQEEHASRKSGGAYTWKNGRASPSESNANGRYGGNGSVVEEMAPDWNLNRLPMATGSLLQHVGGHIEGVVVPWLYIGSTFSAFCWHNEDHYLYSINYLHWGEPKRWYGVAGAEAEAFEAALRDIFPELFIAHPDLLLQLVTTANPVQIAERGVNVYSCTQRQGEFVVTFPQAYHAGFNMGVNCAEAVNFAPPDWLPFGRSAQERYRRFARTPVFSHDALVLALARGAASRLAAEATAAVRMDDLDAAAARGFVKPELKAAATEARSAAAAARAVAAASSGWGMAPGVHGVNSDVSGQEEEDERSAAESSASSAGRVSSSASSASISSNSSSASISSGSSFGGASEARKVKGPKTCDMKDLMLPPLDLLLPRLCTELRAMEQRQLDLVLAAQEAGCENFKHMDELFQRLQGADKGSVRSTRAVPAVVQKGRKRSPAAKEAASSRNRPSASKAMSTTDTGPVGGAQCCICQQYCYMAVVVCEECIRLKGLGKRRVACGAHLTDLCGAHPCRRFTIYCRAQSDELSAQADALEKAGKRVVQLRAAATAACNLKRFASCDAEGIFAGQSTAVLSPNGSSEQGSSSKRSRKEPAAEGGAGGVESLQVKAQRLKELVDVWEQGPERIEVLELIRRCRRELPNEAQLLPDLRRALSAAEVWAKKADVATDGKGVSIDPLDILVFSPRSSAKGEVHSPRALRRVGSSNSNSNSNGGFGGGSNKSSEPAVSVLKGAKREEAGDTDEITEEEADEERSPPHSPAGAAQQQPQEVQEPLHATRFSSRAVAAAKAAAAAAEMAAAADAAAAEAARKAGEARKAKAVSDALIEQDRREREMFPTAAKCLIEGLHLPVREPRIMMKLAALLSESMRLRCEACALLGLPVPAEVELLTPVLDRMCESVGAIPLSPLSSPGSPGARKLLSPVSSSSTSPFSASKSRVDVSGTWNGSDWLLRASDAGTARDLLARLQKLRLPVPETAAVEDAVDQDLKCNGAAQAQALSSPKAKLARNGSTSSNSGGSGGSVTRGRKLSGSGVVRLLPTTSVQSAVSRSSSVDSLSSPKGKKRREPSQDAPLGSRDGVIYGQVRKQRR